MSEAAVVAGTASGTLSDEEVIRRVRAGEGELFEVLMRRYNQRLYRVARSIVKDEAEAEDVMQQAYVNAYTHLDQFADRARFSTWLTRIAVYEALGRLRRRRRVREVDVSSETEGTGATLASAEPSPEQQALTAELRRLLEGAVDALPRTSRSAFVLREVEGLSTAEAAACLGVSEDVVKTRLSRARGMLRKALLERAGVETATAFSFHLSRCDRVVARVLEQITTRTH
jgi:RNA polymerase sigma-70 factor (ECF subfamily)